MKKKVIIFTGGGSGGHIVPALTIIEKIKDNFDIFYLGSYNGIESRLTENKVKQYYGLSTGKFRRYFSFKNILDLFRIVIGTIQAFFILLKLKKQAETLFSTGGFVCVPVIIAAKVLGYRIIIHEQTSRIGLANRISSKFSDKIFVSFESSLKYFPQKKVELSGYPVRDSFKNNEISSSFFKRIPLINKNKPLLFITGGGNGSQLLNDKILDSLDDLKKKYNIIHQTGMGELKNFLDLESANYIPIEFLKDEMPDILKASDIIISRAGAGTVAELMALKKKSIFIPLQISQKNEQYCNAMEAKKYLNSLVIEESEFNEINLVNLLKEFNPEISISNDYKFIDNATELIRNEIIK